MREHGLGGVSPHNRKKKETKIVKANNSDSPKDVSPSLCRS